MHFGSDEMKDLLLLARDNPRYYDEAMETLYETVQQYTLGKIRGGQIQTSEHKKVLTTEYVFSQDYEDIVNEVFCNVLHYLDRFLNNVEQKHYAEPQRQAWLRSVVYSTLAQYLRRRSKDFLLTLFGDMYDGGEEIPYNDYNERLHIEAIINGVLRVVCMAPSKPEKKLAYIFNIIIFHEAFSRNLNSVSSFTSDFMHGKSLFSLKCEMIYLIEHIYGITVFPKDIVPLTELLGGKQPTEAGKTRCEITPKLVTDWTNRMKTYVCKFKSEIFGEEGAC